MLPIPSRGRHTSGQGGAPAAAAAGPMLLPPPAPAKLGLHLPNRPSTAPAPPPHCSLPPPPSPSLPLPPQNPLGVGKADGLANQDVERGALRARMHVHGGACTGGS
jgi:hypothetical protein